MFHQKNKIHISPRRFVPRAVFWPVAVFFLMGAVAFTFWYLDRNVWHDQMINMLPPDTNWFITFPAKDINPQAVKANDLISLVPNHDGLLQFDFINNLSLDAKFINIYQVWEKRKDFLADDITVLSLPEGYAIVARIENKTGLSSHAKEPNLFSKQVGNYFVIANNIKVLNVLEQVKEGQRYDLSKDLHLRKIGQSLFDHEKFKNLQMNFENSLLSGYIASDLETIPLSLPVKDSIFLQTIQEHLPHFRKQKITDLFDAGWLPASFSLKAHDQGFDLVTKSKKQIEPGEKSFATSDLIRTLTIRDTSDMSTALQTLLQVLPGWQVRGINHGQIGQREITIKINAVELSKFAQAEKILDRLEREGATVAGDSQFAVGTATKLADLIIIQTAINEYVSGNNTAPISLDHLTPLYLSSIPIDPITNSSYNYSNSKGDSSFYASFIFENESRLGPPGLYCLTSQGVERVESECVEK